MGGWARSAGCSSIGVAFLFVLAFNVQTNRVEVDSLRQPAGSEVYIQQPPKNATEKISPDKGELKPAAGPMAPSQGTPRTCDPQNASSEACYTATQQARPIPR